MLVLVWKVDAFREGEMDYTKIEGDTGPLVYPAGFLYVYSAIKFLTAGQVFPAQVTPLEANFVLVLPLLHQSFG